MSGVGGITIETRIEQRVTLTLDVPAYVAHRIGNALFQMGRTEMGREILEALGEWGPGFSREIRNPTSDEHYPALDPVRTETA